MRFVVLAAVMCFAGVLRADQPVPSYTLSDGPGSTMGDKVAGHIHWCMVEQSNKPKILFGLTKELDGDPQFTFMVLFRTGCRGGPGC